MTRVLSLAGLASICLISIAAEPASLSQPVLGFAYDTRLNSIRLIRGVPGAALLDESLRIGGLSTAAISPQQRIALVVSADEPQLHLIHLQDGTTRSIAGVMLSPSRIVFSPSGSSAVLIGNAIQVLTGLADSPRIQTMAVPSLTADPVAVAISDDGEALLLGSGAQDGDPVWLLSAVDATRLPLPGSIAAAAFR